MSSFLSIKGQKHLMSGFVPALKEKYGREPTQAEIDVVANAWHGFIKTGGDNCYLEDMQVPFRIVAIKNEYQMCDGCIDQAFRMKNLVL